jgi:hypothetical protein
LRADISRASSTIPKSGYRFSDQIVFKQDNADDLFVRFPAGSEAAADL